MSGKSILCSIFSVLLFVAVVFAIVFLFKSFGIAGIVGFVLLIFPEMLRRKAVSKSNGFLDRVLAKFVVPALFLAGAFLAIMAIGFWIQM